jgi:hypothetical protein
MKGICNLFLALFSPIVLLSQVEEIGPLTSNPDLYSGKIKELSAVKSNPGTFDSTFIYFSDTLSLPFFDEFSRNHFETYSANYSDPGVTSEKKFRILDNVTLLPIANDQYFSAQTTFTRTYDITTSTFTDVNFTAAQYKVGDLSTYPVSYATTSLYPPYYIYDTVGVEDVSDTIWIVNPEYFQDSATQFFANLNNPTAYWLDSKAYHNYRFAVEPRSLGVATFDGLNEDGYPYSIGTTITNYADFLTVKPLDLGGFNASDSVYFSFLYQAEGFGDIPEASDSLVLEFYAKDLDQWNWVWSTSGMTTSEFKVGHIRLINPIYFKKGFQFRFKNYGALSGSLDHFHLDYVNLRNGSGYQDTLFKDFAFVYPIGSLLKTYTSVPWDHFKNSPTGKMNNAFPLVVHNGSNLMENNQNGQVKISYNSAVEGSYVLNAQTLSGGNINYGPNTTYTSYHDLSGGYIYDISKTGDHQSFDLLGTASAQFPNLAQNDSTTGVQYFANYYSYDDGSAEAAYGPTGNQARLAIKYVAYEADSLIGLNMHFVPSVNDVSNKLFLLTVWDDAGGQPGSVLYEDNIFFPRQPIYGDYRNQFNTYYFKDDLKVSVGITYYIGWRQFDADRLNIGLDRNLDNSQKTFYSVNGGVTWVQSTIPGSVMMRPVYSTSLDDELSTVELPAEKAAVLYPNPTNGLVEIDVVNGEYYGVEVFTIQGKLVFDSSEPTVSLIDQPAGIYFFHVNGIDKVYKIVKN